MRSFFQCLFCVVAFCLFTLPALGQDAAWWQTPQRLLQTNLREIDAAMDLDQYVAEVKALAANVVLFNAGGIVANYPTELEFHWRNTLMQGDLLGDVAARLHAEGIRVIGRFDFSKINEQFAAKLPEWLYRGVDGEIVNYNGQVHTCVSGGYQQEYAFKILGEAVSRYPLDGVFFNMIGFQTRDYSGNYHGPCQCDACRTRFRAYADADLPTEEDDSDAVYQKYGQWKKSMVDTQFNRIHDFLKDLRPDLMICTYTETGVDVVRKESNHATPDWLYADTNRALTARLEYPEKGLANAAVHFPRIANRHAGTTPYLTARRLLQQGLNGSWLDFYCIGPLQRLEDRMAIPLVGDVFRFHAANERYLVHTAPIADVGLLRRGGDEFDGVFQILSENHVPFDLVSLSKSTLPDFPAIVVPGAADLSGADCGALDAYVRAGGRLLLTGGVPAALKTAGVDEVLATRPREPGTYLRIRPEDKLVLGKERFKDVDLAFFDGELTEYVQTQQNQKTQSYLRFVPVGMYGPPEKCYYTETSDTPGLLLSPGDNGAVATLPWDIGTQYKTWCHPVHAQLFLSALELAGAETSIHTTLPALVELNHRVDIGGRFETIGLINHTGQMGNAVHAPVTVRGAVIEIKPRRPVSGVRMLHAGESIPFTTGDHGWLRCVLPSVGLFEVLVFEYAEA